MYRGWKLTAQVDQCVGAAGAGPRPRISVGRRWECGRGIRCAARRRFARFADCAIAADPAPDRRVQPFAPAGKRAARGALAQRGEGGGVRNHRAGGAKARAGRSAERLTCGSTAGRNEPHQLAEPRVGGVVSQHQDPGAPVEAGGGGCRVRAALVHKEGRKGQAQWTMDRCHVGEEVLKATGFRASDANSARFRLTPMLTGAHETRVPAEGGVMLWLGHKNLGLYAVRPVHRVV